MTTLQIHTTDRATFKTCRQRWDFVSPLRMGLEPLRPQLPLWFGTGMHQALGAYYDPETPRRVSLALEAWNEFCRTEKQRFINQEGDLWVEEEDEFRENEELGRGILTHYAQWAPEHDNFDVVWVEKEFKVPLFDNVVYSFRADGLAKDSQGKFWLLEHKTASRIEDNREWLSMDDQVGSYICMIQKALDIKLEGVIYNTLRKKVPQPLRQLKSGAFSQDKSQDTTLEYALETLRKENIDPSLYSDFLQFLQNKGNTFFKRDRVFRNQNELSILYEHIIAEAKMMVDENVLITRTPSMFNCRNCAFVAPCITKYEDSDWQLVLKVGYRERKKLYFERSV